MSNDRTFVDKSANKAGDAALCSAFAQCWSEGRRITVEEFLATERVSASEDEELVAKLVQWEVNLRRQRGDAPSVVEYQRRFPRLQGELLDEIISLPTPPTVDEPTPLFPSRYRAIGELGRGGIGSVWRIHDRELDRVLAAKVLVGRLHHVLPPLNDFDASVS